MKKDGKYGMVCFDEGFGDVEANVACKATGFAEGFALKHPQAVLVCVSCCLKCVW